MVFWLTLTSAVSIYFHVERDDAISAISMSKDYGYGGFYIVLTMVIIVFSTGDRDTIIANRVVSNITGILAAVIFAVIPPAVYGGNPSYAQQIVDEEKRALKSCLRFLLDLNPEGIDELRKNHNKEGKNLRSEADYLFEDAKRLNQYPFYRVDLKLEDELKSIGVTSAFNAELMLLAKRCCNKDNEKEISALQKRFVEVLEDMDRGFVLETLPDTEQPEERSSPVDQFEFGEEGDAEASARSPATDGDDLPPPSEQHDDATYNDAGENDRKEETKETAQLDHSLDAGDLPMLFLQGLRVILKRFAEHEIALSSVHWGFRPKFLKQQKRCLPKARAATSNPKTKDGDASEIAEMHTLMKNMEEGREKEMKALLEAIAELHDKSTAQNRADIQAMEKRLTSTFGRESLVGLRLEI